MTGVIFDSGKAHIALGVNINHQTEYDDGPNGQKLAVAKTTSVSFTCKSFCPVVGHEYVFKTKEGYECRRLSITQTVKTNGTNLIRGICCDGEDGDTDLD